MNWDFGTEALTNLWNGQAGIGGGDKDDNFNIGWNSGPQSINPRKTYSDANGDGSMEQTGGGWNLGPLSVDVQSNTLRNLYDTAADMASNPLGGGMFGGNADDAGGSIAPPTGLMDPGPIPVGPVISGDDVMH